MRLLLSLLLLSLAACDRSPEVTYRTEPVTRGPLAEIVSATGEVSAVVSVNVGSQVSGTVAQLYADFNSEVKKGQVLADLDPRLFKAALARAEASLAAAEADVEKARADHAEKERQERRTLDLAKRQLASIAEQETAQSARAGAAAQLRSAQARVQQARAERDTARTNLELSRIRSPIDGIVISRSIDVGQTVAASFQAPILFLIANDLSAMQVLAHVDEADVGKVHRGMTARFTVDAYPGETFSGTVREVRQAPTTIQNVVTYSAVIDAPNPQKKLRQGMTAQVTLVSAEREDSLRVANAALRYRPPNGDGGSAPAQRPGTPGVARAAPPAGDRAAAARERPVAGGERAGGRAARVFKLEGGAPVPVEVTVGITDGRQTEVLAGLAEGDQVVVGDSSSTGGGAAPRGMRRGPF
jgi:HlyD family secretion protein